MTVLTTKPKEWESYQRNYPSGFIAITTKEAVARPDILKAARTFIDKNVREGKPIGYCEQITLKGKPVIFTIEPHYHEPNGPTRPWGWHKGCSVAVEAPHIGADPDLGEDDMGMDAATHTKVKKAATVAIPATLGFFFLGGPVGLALGIGVGAAINHFKK